MHDRKDDRLIADRYEIRKSLGRGGFSEVWLAYDRQLKRDVALKQLFGSVEDETFRKQRDREIETHSKLRSKHVIHLHDAFVHDGSQYLVLELMDYSLSRFVDKVSIDRVLHWMKDCLLGLNDIHEHGVIHRDIKPGNIFQDHQGSIRIGDFGVAQTGQSASLPALSPKFIAPEIIVGDSSKVGPSSDLYSLGLVMYQLILGDVGAKEAFPELYVGVDRPEALNNRWLLWHNNLDRPAPALSSLQSETPKDVSDWVMRMVDKDPTKRYQSAREALAAMPGDYGQVPEPLRHAKDESIDQSSTKDSSLPATPSRLSPATLLAIVVVVSAGLYFLLQNGEPRTAFLALEPAGSEELKVQWNGSVLEQDSNHLYLLTEPIKAGELTILIDTFLLLDTSITIAEGDSIKLIIGPHLVRLENFTHLSMLSTYARTFGGPASDGANDVYTTSDGGYIVAGWTDSKGAGANDAWLIKLDSRGSVQWDRTYGGPAYDGAEDVSTTSDGGYIVVGTTASKGNGDKDAWLFKVDRHGDLEWDRTYGGFRSESVFSVSQTFDGGYVIAGYTESKGAGGLDAWMIKTDRIGNILWDRTKGASFTDVANSVSPTLDGGYVMAGMFSADPGMDYEGAVEAWLIKTDNNGNVEWDRTYGGDFFDEAQIVLQTPDAGYVLAGSTGSDWSSDSDVWLIKLDGNGNIQWDQSYGGPLKDEANDISLTSDGGYVLVCTTRSKGAGDYDVWLIKTDKLGNVLWDRTFGGSQWDIAGSVSRTPDGGYIVAGSTKSRGAGDWDAWIIKTDSLGNVDESSAFYQDN